MKLYLEKNIFKKLSPEQGLSIAAWRKWLKIALGEKTFTLHNGEGKSRVISSPEELVELISTKTGLDKKAVSLKLFEWDVSPCNSLPELKKEDKKEEKEEEKEEKEEKDEKNINSKKKEETIEISSGKEAGGCENNQNSNNSGYKNSLTSKRTSDKSTRKDLEKKHFTLQSSLEKFSNENIEEWDGKDSKVLLKKSSLGKKNRKKKEGIEEEIKKLSEISFDVQKIEHLIKEIDTHMKWINLFHMWGNSLGSLYSDSREFLIIEPPIENGRLNYKKYYIKKLIKERFKLENNLTLNYNDYDKRKNERDIIFYLDDSQSMVSLIRVVEWIAYELKQFGLSIKILRGPNWRVYKEVDGKSFPFERYSLYDYIKDNKINNTDIYIFSDDDPHRTVRSIMLDNKTKSNSVVWYHVYRDTYEGEIKYVRYKYIKDRKDLKYFQLED